MSESDALDAELPEPTFVPERTCGKCQRGYYYLPVERAGWRRSPSDDTPAYLAWRTDSGTVYCAPRDLPPPEFAQLCNCVRHINNFPMLRWQEMEQVEVRGSA